MLINKTRAKEIMEKHGVDALVATTPENVAYLTGFWILTSLRHKGRQIYAVISRDDTAPDMIVSRGLIDNPLLGDTWVRRFQVYGDFYIAPEDKEGLDGDSKKLLETLKSLPAHKTALDALVNSLESKGLSNVCVGVDQGSDVIFLENALRERIPGLKTKPAYEIFREIRTIKTPEEVDRIRGAVRVNETALSEAINTIGEGVTEEEVSLAFQKSVVSQGGLPALACIGSGPRGAFPNVEPSGRKIKKGDVVRFDVGCIYKAYHADLARTAVLGPPSPKQQKYHDALVEGQGKILEAIKPGVIIKNLFEIGVSEIRKMGIPHYQRQHCGHGNGIEGYDLPLITANNETRIEPGMVLCVETPYYEPGFAGLQIEDIIVVTNNGYERISQLERKLFVV